MTRKLILLFVTICSVTSSRLLCQEAIETPQHFGQFYNNPLLNLTRNGLDSKFEISLDNQRNVGGFSGVSTSYFSFFYNSKTEEKSKNIYGVYLYNDREGDFIFRRRAQFSFARHQQISENWNLALALSGGLYTFGIKPTSSTGAYSSNSFEGNSSLLFYSDKLQFGLSMNQFTNSKIQPVSQITRLKRHYYLFAQYKWKVEKLDFLPSAFIKHMNTNNPLSYIKSTTAGVSLRAIYRILMTGVSVDSYGVYFTAGLENWTFLNSKLGIDFSYAVPTAANTINVNKMEINLNLKI
jgi:hypothetical protein